MIDQVTSATATRVAELMVNYSLDLGGYSVQSWIEQWLTYYPAAWLYSAVVEALYQGRYKAVSIAQILELWRRRGKPVHHFSRDFERIISGRSSLLSREAISPDWIAAQQPDNGLETTMLVAIEAGQSLPGRSPDGRLVDPTARSRWLKPHSPDPDAQLWNSTLDWQSESSAVLWGIWSPGSTAPQSGTQTDPTSDDPSQIDRTIIAEPLPAIPPFRPHPDAQLPFPVPQPHQDAPTSIRRFVPHRSAALDSKLQAIAQSLQSANVEAITRRLRNAKANQLTSTPPESPIAPEPPLMPDPAPRSPLRKSPPSSAETSDPNRIDFEPPAAGLEDGAE